MRMIFVDVEKLFPVYSNCVSTKLHLRINELFMSIETVIKLKLYICDLYYYDWQSKFMRAKQKKNIMSIHVCMC